MTLRLYNLNENEIEESTVEAANSILSDQINGPTAITAFEFESRVNSLDEGT